MLRIFSLLLLLVSVVSHGFTISLSSSDFQTFPQFSSVQTFQFEIEVEGELTPGVYNNPTLVGVDYSVSGTLVAGTPSGFPAFQLEREITGVDFYNQGSSLNFEISATADLSDGLQFDELVGDNPRFVFNGREIDNGRFHPALFELSSDGSGRIQNSNNTPTLDPLLEVDFGEEYITDVTFDAGNLVLATPVPTPTPIPTPTPTPTAEPTPQPTSTPGGSSGDGGSMPIHMLVFVFLFGLYRFYQIGAVKK